MPSAYDVRPGQRFSFEVYPTSIIGNYFRDVYLEGILTPSLAQASGLDIEALHAKVYPTLPHGSVADSAQSYDYIRIRHPNGASDIIGIPWIRPETIQLFQGGRVVLTFDNKTQSDVQRILQVLSANGESPSNVQVENHSFG
jgi:hypothetical protein